MRRFGDWLASTEDLQRAFGAEPRGLAGEALAEYLTWNFAALTEELGELMHELPWAPWKSGRGEPTPGQLDRAREEWVDMQHFAANIALALGLTDELASELYAAKQQVNRERLRTGRSLETPT